MTKTEFNKKETLLSRKVALSFSKEPIKCYIWIIALCDTKNLTLRKVDLK
jgi:hypothetical protein